MLIDERNLYRQSDLLSLMDKERKKESNALNKGQSQNLYIKKNETLEIGMCDVIKIRLKRRDAMRSKIKYLIFGNPSYRIGRSTAVLIFSGWVPFTFLVASLL